jgi:hypothetical protein
MYGRVILIFAGIIGRFREPLLLCVLCDKRSGIFSTEQSYHTITTVHILRTAYVHLLHPATNPKCHQKKSKFFFVENEIFTQILITPHPP